MSRLRRILTTTSTVDENAGELNGMVSVPIFTAPLGQASRAETKLEPICSMWLMFAYKNAIVRHSSTAMVHERVAFLEHLKTRITLRMLKSYASLLCYIAIHMRPTDPNAVSADEIIQGAIQWTNTYPSDSEQRIERKREEFRGLARSFYRFLGVYAPSRVAFEY